MGGVRVSASFIDAGQKLPEREREQFYRAVLEYLAYGTEPDYLGGTAVAIWVAIEKTISKSRSRAVAGSIGGKAHGCSVFERDTLPNRLRFDILARDNFTCRYCGRSAPDVALNVDHVFPVAKGGTNDPDNLVTACFECNNGKADREL